MNPRFYRFLIAAALVGFGSAAAVAADLDVVYLEGTLQLQISSGWKALDIGDSVPDTATIRFDGRGVAELEGAGLHVTLRQEGVFKVADMLGKNREVASTGLGSLVKGRVTAAFQGTQKSASVVMGVRAAEISAADNKVSWLGSATDLLAQAKKHLEAEEYGEALEALAAAQEYAEAVEEAEILYYSGYANAMAGNGGAALQSLDSAEVTPAHPFYGEFLMLRGQLLLEALAFDDALESFETYRAAFPSGTDVPLANLMAGYCASELGDTARAKQSLERAQSADPSSEIARQARELLAKL